MIKYMQNIPLSYLQYIYFFILFIKKTMKMLNIFFLNMTLLRSVLTKLMVYY